MRNASKKAKRTLHPDNADESVVGLGLNEASAAQADEPQQSNEATPDPADPEKGLESDLAIKLHRWFTDKPAATGTRHTGHIYRAERLAAAGAGSKARTRKKRNKLVVQENLSDEDFERESGSAAEERGWYWPFHSYKLATFYKWRLVKFAALALLVLLGVCWTDCVPPDIEIADDFVTYNYNTVDYLSGVTVADARGPVEIDVFDDEVLLGREGVYPVIYTVTDGSNNVRYASAQVQVVIDIEAPVISGVQDIEILLGESILYKNGVDVRDNLDTEVALNVDTLEVNTREPGEYTVYYSATDSAGNTATVPAKVSILEGDTDGYSPALLDAMVEELLADILSDDMDLTEQARAIYDWTRTQIRYIGWVDKSDWRKGAYMGLYTRTGNCFTYYAVSRELLTAIGAENMMVRRLESYATEHYWNLVNLGTGWYHFDATVAYAGHPKNFMMTDDFAMNYYYRQGFYDYDKSLYPEVSNVPFEES